MKIINEVTNEIPVSEMKDGQLAIITKWEHEESIGKVIQKYADNLVVLGETWGQCYTEISKWSQSIDEQRRVRILLPGTQIEL